VVVDAALGTVAGFVAVAGLVLVEAAGAAVPGAVPTGGHWRAFLAVSVTTAVVEAALAADEGAALLAAAALGVLLGDAFDADEAAVVLELAGFEAALAADEGAALLVAAVAAALVALEAVGFGVVAAAAVVVEGLTGVADTMLAARTADGFTRPVDGEVSCSAVLVPAAGGVAGACDVDACIATTSLVPRRGRPRELWLLKPAGGLALV